MFKLSVVMENAHCSTENQTYASGNDYFECLNDQQYNSMLIAEHKFPMYNT